MHFAHALVDMFPYSYSYNICVNELWLALRNYVLDVIHATVANLNCVSVENFVQFVASGLLRLLCSFKQNVLDFKQAWIVCFVRSH